MMAEGSHSPITADHSCVILDACCLMNLYASRHMAEIVATITEKIAVATYVKNEEALFVYQASKQDQPAKTEAVDIDSLVEAGLIRLVELGAEIEKGYFAALTARRLDDGEAITAAMAINRHWALATDDRRARSILGQEAPQIALISTPQLVKHWADSHHPEPAQVNQAMRDIERRANFLVGKRDPLYNWWHEDRL